MSDRSAGSQHDGAWNEASAQDPARRPRSLLTIVAAILTIALLPIGAIAVLQTQRAIEVANANYRADRLDIAMRIATPEREAIVAALGLASGVAGALAMLAPDSAACTRLMERTSETHPEISFIGLIAEDRSSVCNSTNETVQFQRTAAVESLFESPQSQVSYDADGQITQSPVVIVSHPVRSAEGELLGIVALSFPARTLDEARAQMDVESDAHLMTFQPDGDILTASTGDIPVEDALPDTVALGDLVIENSQSFSALNRDGEARHFAVVPIAPGTAYALASWPARGPLPGQTLLILSSLSFPLAMWLVSLAVALVSMQFLVIRPIAALRRTMRSFADRRQIPFAPELRETAAELRDIDRTFHRMAEKITRDEADVENKLHEREILLREVHHRVKNNLQLMSSIMNMQMRRSGSPEVRAAIRNLQDRLSSLAMVHRTLYQASDVARVRADSLIEDVVRELVSLASSASKPAVQIHFDLEAVTLDPDQAGPLALLTAEAVTNALKYVEPDETGVRWLRVSLGHDRKDKSALTLVIENSTSANAVATDDQGLGTRLIRAFASQLEARVEQEAAEGRYRVRVTFAAAS
ncbi:MAG: hypothetical protein HLUCCA24_00430 [Rhodobacteraceae bacterium HLUCCA24]|nr:MAG: hypothetical protein HLUCCA24_00430 [Rhodobacteraceae bacterium HLUCCA24]